MKTQVMQITPELAQQFLAKNTSNRKIMNTVVAGYVREMKAGYWHETHQGIAFYEDGTLADGQHRLTAITKAGISVNMVVTFDLKKPAALGIDCGAKKGQADVLVISGEDWATKDTVAILSLILFGGRKKSPTEIKNCASHDLLDAVRFACEAVAGHARGIGNASVRGAIALAVLNGVDKSVVQGFCSVLKSGINRESGDVSVILLRNTLLTSKTQKSGSDREKAMRTTQNALKAYMSGVDLKLLKTPESLIWSVKGAA